MHQQQLRMTGWHFQVSAAVTQHRHHWTLKGRWQIWKAVWGIPPCWRPCGHLEVNLVWQKHELWAPIITPDFLVATGYGAEDWEGLDESLVKRRPPPKIRSSWRKCFNWALWCPQQTDEEPGRSPGPPLNDRQLSNMERMGQQKCNLPLQLGMLKVKTQTNKKTPI